MTSSTVRVGLSQIASVQPNQETAARIRMLQDRRGSLPSETTLMIEVAGSDYDSDKKSTVTVDTRGRFLRVGEDPSTRSGFDGQLSWSRDPSGFSQKLAFSDRDISIFLVWLRSGQWLDQVDHSDLEFEETESSELQTVFSVNHSRTTSKVCVSNQTGLVDWLKFHGIQGDVTCSFSNYEKHFGVAIPTTFRSESALGTYESRVTSVKKVTSEIDFSKPAMPPPNIRIDTNVSNKLNAQRTPSGHVIVDVSLADAKVRKFVFDTGAGATVIDERLAKELNLDHVGEQALGSIFGTGNTAVYRCRSLIAGPATLENIRLVSMDLSAIRSMLGDERIEGIIGFDLLSQCVCEIELANDSIRIFNEPSYTQSNRVDFRWEELFMLQNVPLVPATFPQGAGIFRMDVGAASGPAGNAIFHTPTVERFQIDTSSMQTVKSGDAEFAVGTVEWFELGGHRFDRPLVLYSVSKTGPLAEANIDGNLGVEFLKFFRLILDYRNSRMALIPIAK